MAAGMAVLVLAVFSSDLTYPLVAEAFALPETKAIVQPHDAVALVVRGDRAALLAFAPLAQMHHLHGSVVTSDALTSREVARLRAAGLDPIPELRAEGVRWSLTAERALKAQVREYGLGGSFHYLAPHDGFTITEYLFARHLGGKPLQGSVTLTARGNVRLQPGIIVTATLGPGSRRGAAAASVVAAAQSHRSFDLLRAAAHDASTSLTMRRAVPLTVGGAVAIPLGAGGGGVRALAGPGL